MSAIPMIPPKWMSAKSSVDEPNTWKTWVSAHKKLAANCNTNRNSNPLSPSFPNTLLHTTASLERQFNHLREQYYFERFNLIERQLSEVRSGRSEEFVQPQKELDKVYRTRIEVADVLRKFRLQNIEHKYLSEEQAASQHFEVIQSIIYHLSKSNLIHLYSFTFLHRARRKWLWTISARN